MKSLYSIILAAGCLLGTGAYAMEIESPDTCYICEKDENFVSRDYHLHPRHIRRLQHNNDKTHLQKMNAKQRMHHLFSQPWYQSGQMQEYIKNGNKQKIESLLKDKTLSSKNGSMWLDWAKAAQEEHQDRFNKRPSTEEAHMETKMTMGAGLIKTVGGLGFAIIECARPEKRLIGFMKFGSALALAFRGCSDFFNLYDQQTQMQKQLDASKDIVQLLEKIAGVNKPNNTPTHLQEIETIIRQSKSDIFDRKYAKELQNKSNSTIRPYIEDLLHIAQEKEARIMYRHNSFVTESPILVAIGFPSLCLLQEVCKNQIYLRPIMLALLGTSAIDATKMIRGFLSSDQQNEHKSNAHKITTFLQKLETSLNDSERKKFALQIKLAQTEQEKEETQREIDKGEDFKAAVRSVIQEETPAIRLIAEQVYDQRKPRSATIATQTDNRGKEEEDWGLPPKRQ